ncbi:hypothetical protein [Tautonia rosea]|uniref:hypothetical protein n=1 Tax=Tautonia rosea TaxID=2728037 RepID=UPI001472FC3B|nr:hypothetical protein [Tautonia rosea]
MILLPAVILSLSGCSDDRSQVVIATPWDRTTCRQFTALLAQASGDPIPVIRWVRLDPWDDPARLIEADHTVHLLLGWPTATLAELNDRGRLDRSEAGTFRCVGTEGSERFRFTSPDTSATAILPGDPRIDPVARRQVASRLARGAGRTGYASLIESGLSSVHSAEDPAPVRESEGFSVASIATPVHPEARAFRDRLRKQWNHEPLALGRGSPVTPSVRTLSAELIGATLVDAETELHRAREILRQWPDADDGRSLLVEPPLWPPDSIRRLANDPTRRSMIETLAAALVDDPESRAWLLDSWQAPPRPVDGALLDALATANEGRLLRSTRVLPWLRAEWTAWARQRYAQIARELDVGAEETAR